RLDATAELERSAEPQTGGVAAERQSSEATASKTGEAIPSTQPIIHSTSSAEYIVSEIKRHKVGVVVGLLILIIAIGGGGVGLYKIFNSRTTGSSSHQPKFTA